MPQKKKYRTATERKQAWRERNRERDRKHSKKFRTQRKKNCTSDEKEKERRMSRERSKRYRMNKKLSNAINNAAPERLPGYSCKQTLNKAVKKVKLALPSSPRKRRQVLQTFDLGALSSTSTPARTPWNKLTDADIKIVQDFYSSDLVSWKSPNMRDSIKVKGGEDRIQRCYMVITLREAFSLFQINHLDTKLGFSRFCSLRPSFVRLSKFVPHQTCLCRYHENFRNKIKTVLPEFGSTQLFVRNMSCNNDYCMSNSDCEACIQRLSHFLQEHEERFEETSPPYHTWQQIDKRYEKILIEDATIENVLKEVCQDFGQFKFHCFVKWSQSDAFEQSKLDLSVDECVIQVGAKIFSKEIMMQVLTSLYLPLLG